MNDDTVVTPFIQNAAGSWRTWAPYVGAGIVSAYSLVYAFGGSHEHSTNFEANYARDQAVLTKYQADMKEQVNRVEAKVDALAKVPAQVDDLGHRQERMEDNWDNAFEHAGDKPRPQRSHRAH